MSIDKSDLIYGKDPSSGLVSITISDSEEVIVVDRHGFYFTRVHKPWIIYAEPKSDKCALLTGNNKYKYLRKYDSREERDRALELCRKQRVDHFRMYNDVEAVMVRHGYSYFKGMAPNDLNVLSFDIETSGLIKDRTSRVFLISNTYRDLRGNVIRRLFCVDDYADQKEMISAWENWVCSMNPNILLGHNIFGFDLPYLEYCSGGLDLFRFSERESEFRKNGSQHYTYRNVTFGSTEIVDTMFLAIKSDIGLKYESYGLKQIIKQEGLERKDRQHYEAGQIGTNWDNLEERAKIKAYAEHDADDALALYDLLIPPWFYYAQMVPMPFQNIINTATGRQINNVMLRAYLQDKESVPGPSMASEYEGAISIGNPGLYSHVYKVDVASLYPSIIRQNKIYSKDKDPKGRFLELVESLTIQRLANKQKAKETGERHYKDLEQSQKLVINSAYGFLGAPGLNFNEPSLAADVTRIGRGYLNKAIGWAELKGFKIVNADTDSISFSSGEPLDNYDELVAELNSLFPDLIRWEKDGEYKAVLVVAAKNYVLMPHKGSLIVKGASLKAPYKEPALRAYINETISLILSGRKDELIALYNNYAKKITNITNISEWCVKKTVTKSVLNPERANEQRVLDALDLDAISEGDKVYVYYRLDDQLATRESFDGVYDRDRLYGKLYKTLCIFDTVLDAGLFPNYSLKRNRGKLCELS